MCKKIPSINFWYPKFRLDCMIEKKILQKIVKDHYCCKKKKLSQPKGNYKEVICIINRITRINMIKFNFS